nr:flavodoxin family protein [uncultured Aminipila sp.]
MKILLLNGSPRIKGNTETALNQIIQGIQSNIHEAQIELFNITDLKISGCINCDACKKNDGNCVMLDDSFKIIQKIYDSDIVILGTPVYYWGITSQLKTVIDKLYSKESQFRQQKKKIGIVVIGEASLDDLEYRLISNQFECICDYFGWSLIFNKSVCAFEAGDLAKDNIQLQELKSFWMSV